MIKFKILGFLLLILHAAIVNAQSVTFFKDAKGNLYTNLQVDSIVAEKSRKVKDLGMLVQLNITDKTINGDTLLYTYSLKISNDAVLQNDEKKAGYLNKPLPTFRFKSLNNQTISWEDLKGKPVIINMWFTTCAPCIAEMPELNALQQKYKNTDIVFLAMTYETRDKVADFLKKNIFTFQHIPEVKSYCELFTNNYPVNIFVDRKGTVLEVQNGMPMVYDNQKKQFTQKVDPQEFEKALKRILE